MAADLRSSRTLFGAAFIFLIAVATGVDWTWRQPTDAPPSNRTVEIRRTSHGIPHIRSADEKGLGFGIGYAYAQDNLCLLAAEILTVNGERSKYLGAEAKASATMTNVDSDFFFRWLNDEEAIAAVWRSQPAEIQSLLEGYAAGYNYYLREAGVEGLPFDCRNEKWVRPISEFDLLKNMRRLVVRGGVGRFAEAIVSGASASSKKSSFDPHSGEYSIEGIRFGESGEDFASANGSNALAIGKALSRNGRGLLLANPHFPWSGPLRFYQMHLTIPDKLDVMGAALPGLPVINIGFTRNMAWTHTVDASSHFLIYRLKRDVADPRRYVVDGKSTAMQRKSVTVDVREESGSITQRSRDFYRTEFGVVLDMSDRFGRDDEHAYVIDDVNLTNDAALEQWFAMNRANSVDGLESVVTRILGIPWVDTIAVGSNGAALFMNVSMIPRVDSEKLSRCRTLDSDRPVSDIHVLDGTRRDCGRNVTSGLRQDGVFPGDRLPILRRDDFVINSNDTAWLANPSQPLTGFSPLVSRENVELGGRARYVLDWLRRRSDVGSPAGQRLGPDDVESLLMRDEVYSASLVMSDLLTLCPKNSEARAEDTETKDLASVCETLRAWDRTADVDANIGYLYFESFMERARKVTNVWRVPFDPSLPIDTPRGLNVGDPAVAEQLKAALAASHRDALKGGFRLDARWGEIQVASRGGREIPIHGGSAALGVYNVIKSSPSGPGKREVASGASYMQIVSFDSSGPQVSALLAFSESADPRSQFFADQTELFSRKEWVRLPFAEEEIKSDPSYRRQTIPY